ncbi:hypothetical protein RJ639_000837 [Escallonia herrerae]|uniref:Uncharacterized protein n=1 Tax=Escallonia herrerae TaxID=1293975 RepID=A0AA89BHJ2_9ASTE|nr:hypothetical protein RJ639_000837 [Escallonia herrerae]
MGWWWPLDCDGVGSTNLEEGCAPLEGGKIADTEPVDLFSGAQNIPIQEGVIALSDPVDLFSAASNISNTEQERTTNHPDSGGGSREAAGSTT